MSSRIVAASNSDLPSREAELEVRGLNARVKELLRHQWQGLLEIQQLQAEMMGELVRRREGGTG